MLTPAKVDRFNRDGFLNAGPLLSNAEVENLSAALDEVIVIGPEGFPPAGPRPVLFRDLNKGSDYQKAGGGPAPVWQIVNIWEASPAFEKLLHNPAIVRAICQLTGFGDLQVWHDQVQYKPPRDGGSTSWHQDAPLWPAIEPMTPVSAWIPLDDADVANGCMWMVPGSHLWGNQRAFLDGIGHLKSLEEFTKLPSFRPPAEAPIQAVEPRACPVRRGEVHFHHSMTWHGSPRNNSERRRRAVAIHVMTSEARYTGREHVMDKFITLKPGEPMAKAGEHFPVICRGGVPA